MTDRPEEFEGTATVEWRANGPGSRQVMAGWHFTIRDADGTMLLAVTEMTIHAPADGGVWADLTMFCDPDGKPVTSDGPRTEIHLGEDGQILKSTYPYLVAGMSVAPPG